MLDHNKLRDTIAAVLEVEPNLITAESSSDSIGTWDSLRHMNLILAIEDEFHVSLPDEDAVNATSYSLLALVLQEVLGAEQ
jgi:acyl carrier protein